MTLAPWELVLVRQWFTTTSTEGTLFEVEGSERKFICYTLEDCVRFGAKVPGKTAIPKGRYPVVVTMSKRFGKPMPLLLNVPDFDGIRIHTGNKPENTEGCILVGADQTSLKDAWIGRSREAFDPLFERIQEVLAAQRQIWITVEGGPKDILANAFPTGVIT